MKASFLLFCICLTGDVSAFVFRALVNKRYDMVKYCTPKKTMIKISSKELMELFGNTEDSNIIKRTKSANFEVINSSSLSFQDIGGYDNIKTELMQCADLLLNYEKYAKYNIRIPKGIIFEGPPGNGKTLLAKCFCGEINMNFISVSGSQFQEKFVGVGSSRVRELFHLAHDNKPCIIFIDEIDAIGRTRSTDPSSSSSEKDDTLNELLIALDGFESYDGVFIIGSTNRVEVLDPALLRPGRIDKNIFIGNPDKMTRKAIVDIHSKCKPIDTSVDIVEMTRGFSGAEIENLLNEAMLYALRNDREQITMVDIEHTLNIMLIGAESCQQTMTKEMLYKVAIHEMGHAICGILTDHQRVIKVALNSGSSKIPGYTLFESTEGENIIRTKSMLTSQLMVLLSGRIAEEIFFGISITTGAAHDIEISKLLVETMVVNYGMGSSIIFQDSSEKSKEIIDYEIDIIFQTAYDDAKAILLKSKPLIHKCAKILLVKNVLYVDEIILKMKDSYKKKKHFRKYL